MSESASNAEGSTGAAIDSRHLRRAFEVACTTYGFCITEDARESIAAMPQMDAEGFARSVVEAEGLNPEYEKKWMRVLANIYSESTRNA